jgi:4-hydroxy-tetrahydrodipicolinate reductase
MSSRNSPEMIFDLMGFGRPPEHFDPRGVEAHGGGAFAGSLGLVADALSLPLDDVVASGTVAVAVKTVDIAAGTVEAGTIAAQRLEVSGMRDGRPLLTFRANWYLTPEVDPAWDLRETGWRVLVEGDTPLDVDIRFPVPADEWAATSPGLTAHRPVNAVPYVCAAEAGIRTTVELPQIIPTLR